MVVSLRDDNYMVQAPISNLDGYQQTLYIAGFGGVGVRVHLGHRSKAEELKYLQVLLRNANQSGSQVDREALSLRSQRTLKAGNHAISIELCDKSFGPLVLPDARIFQAQVNWYAQAYKYILEELYLAKNEWPPLQQIAMRAPSALTQSSFV